MVHRISKDDLKTGTNIERSEHPWASPTVARRLAEDHLRQNPSAYKSGSCEGGGERTVVVLNQNVKAQMPRKKRKVEQQQQQPSGPGWIPQNLRMWG